MAGTENFAANLQYLQSNGAIPGHEHNLPQNVMEAISDLTTPEMDVLIKVAGSTGAHLFLHDENNHVVAMGL